MKITTKNLSEINGNISTTNDNIIITIPTTDQNGFDVVRIDVSGLKDLSNTSAIVYIEDRSDDINKIQQITTRALEIKARLTDTHNPPTEIEKSVLYTELSELNNQLKTIDSSLSLYNLI